MHDTSLLHPLGLRHLELFHMQDSQLLELNCNPAGSQKIFGMMNKLSNLLKKNKTITEKFL